MAEPEMEGGVDVLWEHRGAEDDALVALMEARGAALLDAAAVRERELSIVLTDDATIRRYNATWRGEDKATDVLSFPMDEGEGAPPGGGGPLGDVVLSLDTAAAQATEHGQSLEDELTFLLVHGFCHLLGHDHAEPDEAAQMRAEEERLLARVAPGAARPPTPY
ncbi:MAG: rRNA maturation RNase YbeY [Deltaproteobacteria bacterium]|nr:rRNA maturation RNase YbeY [Deltaproteobacteria bacterium]MCB9789164.1 rRNA maturation RNase YbeY [Deltaproteobacteria bacterium]